MQSGGYMSRESKGNQKGFTLIELLVAIAILAVVTIPLLNAFLMSVRTDAKAKNKMRATTAATSVMEECKSKTWEELTKGMTADEDGEYAESVLKTVDNKLYTVEVFVSSQSGTATAYNEEEMAELYSMDGVHDAIYVQGVELNKNVAKSLKGSAYKKSDEFSGMKRNLKVTVRKKSANKGVQVDVENTYRYGESAVYTTESERIYESSDDSVDLNNIYLLYYPMYNSTASSLNEIVTIDNTDNLPITCYLVCQNLEESAVSKLRLQFRCLEGARKDYKTNPITQVCSNLSLTKNGKGLWLTYLQGESPDTLTDQNWADSANQFEAKKILNFKDLAKENSSNWVYTVTVKAHEGRPGDKSYDKILATFTSTIEK